MFEYKRKRILNRSLVFCADTEHQCEASVSLLDNNERQVVTVKIDRTKESYGTRFGVGTSLRSCTLFSTDCTSKHMSLHFELGKYVYALHVLRFL